MNEEKRKKQDEAHCAENLNNIGDDISADSVTSACACQQTGDVSGTGDNAGSDGGKADDGGKSENSDIKALQEELESVKSELEEQTKKCGEYLERLQRTAAEFDNFKKRTIKEKEALYDDAVCDVIRELLPVIDNLERAWEAVLADSSAQSLKDGVDMVFKQFMEILKNIGVEEIKALDETFDPMRHNAVMHVEDESLGHSVVVEEFQKGYIYKDKVIRYSMVKVAN
ncbi:MAG: nucleotide exchange factor GrpE [Acetivibrionales bacterium]|jgi:molecular chaperone GrpE|nr:nucleotide exchange factor GrpE [Bacillota bacterium]NLP06762.1 nucleotide exchange factor GrpE [Clostridiaceae bacterium]HOA54016.1 nucleotide exchange factor GrpE [Clostridiales bacterium]HPZ05094.1 nucleotide exchange factor GrpE [Clostridiales bacterium]HQD30248.1 nucleotide exchange factor GrpE [Clostridiales bacterium]